MLSPSALSFSFCLVPLFQGILKEIYFVRSNVDYSFVVNSLSTQEEMLGFCILQNIFCDVTVDNACIGLRVQSLQ